VDRDRACMGQTGVRPTRVASWGIDKWLVMRQTLTWPGWRLVIWLSLYKPRVVVDHSTHRVGWHVLHIIWVQLCVHEFLCNLLLHKWVVDSWNYLYTSIVVHKCEYKSSRWEFGTGFKVWNWILWMWGCPLTFCYVSLMIHWRSSCLIESVFINWCSDVMSWSLFGCWQSQCSLATSPWFDSKPERLPKTELRQQKIELDWYCALLCQDAPV